ncbi:hypothetical protein HPB50_020683 [Hyalomma asiaticum]|uniref:Uncharacterized protein n=1 Tax=Hyalomma asiaticum TaxID=266040 RepID=A0ACB7SHU6_HYAAI|nr:hypothetical protein HPB50_020683 [Hyalomma asiaticum]
MAKKLPPSREEDASGSKPKHEKARVESSRGQTDGSPPRGSTGSSFPNDKAHDDGRHAKPTYNVPYSSTVIFPQLVPFNGIAATSSRSGMTSGSARQQDFTDAADSLPPGAAQVTRDAAIDEQLRLASTLSLRTGERMLSVLETSCKIHNTVRQLSGVTRGRVPSITPTRESNVHDGEAQAINCGKPGNSDAAGRSPAVPSSSVAPAATRFPRDRADWNQVDNVAGLVTELRHHQEFQHNLAESAGSVLGEILREVLSLKTSVESTLAMRPSAVSSSETWIPVKLAQRVSRVYYFSRGYAEEVSSGPLKVSGYTVRLNLVCEIKRREVVLSFRAQFCACTANEKAMWPFTGELELTIHHPSDPTSNRAHRLRPSRRQETAMPRLVDNAPMHVAGPVGVYALDEEGLWAAGTLHLSIKVLL